VSFPLAQWIDDRRTLPHNLGGSGLVGQLASVRRAVRDRMAPDSTALREELGKAWGLSPSRVFLTHGATEADSLALLHIDREVRSQKGRAPVLRVTAPEYPVLGDVARKLGYLSIDAPAPADVAVLSDPNNPTGMARSRESLAEFRNGTQRALIDQTFRDFLPRSARVLPAEPGLWVAGSFTKAFGADGYRIGFVAPPEEEVDAFGAFHSLVLDGLPDASVSAARALIAHRSEIHREGRALFQRNLAYLRRRVRGVPRLDVPLWFDRGDHGLDGDGLGAEATARGVLVCPGSLFGDRTGVRVCLTRKTFPNALDAYLPVRDEWGARGPP
jgi:histidinol-phosphate/aromatic aminotransferase/cobyric acid decarboxylase-like protein